MKKELLDLFICPITGSKLNVNHEQNLLINELGWSYSIINDTPILVNFEDSVINESGFSKTLVQRKKYFQDRLPFVKSLVSTNYQKTKTNFLSIVNRLKQNAIKKKILVIGGGTRGKHTQILEDCNNADIFSFDIYLSPQIDFVADAHKIPLKSGSFDVVIIQYVLEHVINPHEVVAEIYRVLNHEGVVYAETPFLEQVHEGAYDFQRFTESGHRWLFNKFELIKSGVLGGPGVHVMWSIEYLFRGIFRSPLVGKVFKLLFFWVQYLDYIIPEPFKSDSADTLFFYGKKSVDTIGKKSLINFYKGRDNK